MKHYELLTVLPGTLVENEVTPIIDEIKNAFVQVEIEGAQVEDLGKNKLAYPIKHIRYGYFHIIKFTSETSKIADLQKKLRLMTQLLRTVITTYDPAHREHDSKYKIQTEGLTTLSEIRKHDEQPKRTSSDRRTVEPPKSKAPTTVEKKEKIKLTEIDEKLDQILDSELKKV